MATSSNLIARLFLIGAFVNMIFQCWATVFLGFAPAGTWIIPLAISLIIIILVNILLLSQNLKSLLIVPFLYVGFIFSRSKATSGVFPNSPFFVDVLGILIKIFELSLFSIILYVNYKMSLKEEVSCSQRPNQGKNFSRQTPSIKIFQIFSVLVILLGARIAQQIYKLSSPPPAAQVTYKYLDEINVYSLSTNMAGVAFDCEVLPNIRPATADAKLKEWHFDPRRARSSWAELFRCRMLRRCNRHETF